MTHNLSIIDLGLCDYDIALQKQKETWQKRVNNEIPDTLILVEHKPVFTIGKHGNVGNLHISETLLKQKNISLYRIERGGDITFHGFGQLVGYPIVKLSQPIIGIRHFIYQIEQIIIDCLKAFDITAQIRHPYIGVWVQDKKIASIGIAVKNHVTFHGFALNISTDLSYFDWINPCGIKNIKMTSIEKILKKEIVFQQVKNQIEKDFRNIFTEDKIKAVSI